jgi:hypothetical protein
MIAKEIYNQIIKQCMKHGVNDNHHWYVINKEI